VVHFFVAIIRLFGSLLYYHLQADYKADLIVMGTRGMGALKILSLVVLPKM
jgi:nucleotide-binding universal stress UspA family protein